MVIEAKNEIEDAARPIAKWGNAAIAGWQPLPDVLLKNQHKIGLTATQLVVLINVLSFWWYADKLPYPRLSSIAKRMNVSQRTVQRSMETLVQKGLLKKAKTVGQKNNDVVDCYDISGIVSVLKSFAVNDPDYIRRREKVVQDEKEMPF